MIVTFHQPPVANPFVNFDPTNPLHYPPSNRGVYIIGIKKDNKFCPLYVGETENLFHRLFCEHWRLNGASIGSGGFNTEKEIFDLNAPTKNIYGDIKIWNTHWASLSKSKKSAGKIPFFNLVSKSKGGTLIWFSAPEFFDHYFGTTKTSKYESAGGKTKGHAFSISNDLPKNFITSKSLLKDVTDSKQIMTNDFYFLFAEIKNGISLKEVEADTKAALVDSHNIYTYAHVHKTKHNHEIDFGDNIVENLVKL